MKLWWKLSFHGERIELNIGVVNVQNVENFNICGNGGGIISLTGFQAYDNWARSLIDRVTDTHTHDLQSHRCVSSLIGKSSEIDSAGLACNATASFIIKLKLHFSIIKHFKKKDEEQKKM